MGRIQILLAMLGHTSLAMNARYMLASFPSLLCFRFLITCSMQKWREKAWGISSRDPRYDCQMSSRLLSTAKWYTIPILCSVLATKMGLVPAESYTKCVKHSDAIPRLKATAPNGYRVTGVKIKYPAVTPSSRGVAPTISLLCVYTRLLWYSLSIVLCPQLQPLLTGTNTQMLPALCQTIASCCS